MTFHLLYEACGWHTRCALFDDAGRLLTLRYDDISRPLIEGAVVWGRVRQVVPSLGAAFIDIGDTHDGLLALSTWPKDQVLHQGACVQVRIVRGGFGEKGAKLDGRVVLKAEHLPQSCPQVVVAAPSALKRALRDAGNTPVKCWIPHGLYREEVAKVVRESQIFQLDKDQAPHDWLQRIDEELARILAPIPTFPFPPANPLGDLRVELTSAVATMDVNFKPINAPKTDAVLAANLAAAEEVARLVRLLDLGGSVIVDFITPKTKAQREMVDDHLHAALATTDDNFEHLRPMSRHGLAELTRARTGPSLMLLLKTPAFVAGTIGLELWRTPAGANPKLQGQVVQAHPAVLEYLKPQLPETLTLRVLGRPIRVEPEALKGLAEWQLLG
jgi:Ribonuclease G/E